MRSRGVELRRGESRPRPGLVKPVSSRLRRKCSRGYRIFEWTRMVFARPESFVARLSVDLDFTTKVQTFWKGNETAVERWRPSFAAS